MENESTKKIGFVLTCMEIYVLRKVKNQGTSRINRCKYLCDFAKRYPLSVAGKKPGSLLPC